MCLTTFWETPPFKVASKRWCSPCWIAVSWHPMSGGHRTEPKLQINIQMDLAHCSLCACHSRIKQKSRLPLTCGCKRHSKFQLPYWGMNSWLHISQILTSRLSFFPSGRKYLQQWSSFSRQCFCWPLQDLAKLLPRLLFVHAPLSGKLWEPYVSVAHCWLLWLFVQNLLILDKHLEMVIRMYNMCLHTCIWWHMAHVEWSGVFACPLDSWWWKKLWSRSQVLSWDE